MRLFLVPVTQQPLMCGDFLVTAVVQPAPFQKRRQTVTIAAVPPPSGFSLCVKHSWDTGIAGAYGSDSFLNNPQFLLRTTWATNVVLIVNRTGSDAISIHVFQNQDGTTTAPQSRSSSSVEPQTQPRMVAA